MTERKQSTLWIYLTVFTIYLAGNMTMIMNSALAPLAERVYTDVPYSTVMIIGTVLTFAMVPTNIYVGAQIGKRLRYKTTSLVGMFMVLVGGVAPAFIVNITAVIVLRVILGLGLGMLMAMQGAMVQAIVPADKQASLLGFGGVVMSASAIVFQLLSGWLAEGNPLNAYLIYLAIVISIVIMLPFKEPSIDLSQPESGNDSVHKDKIPGRVIVTSLLFMFVFIFFYPAILNVTGIIMDEGIGTSSLGGVVGACYTLGGVIGGAIIGKISKISGKFAVPIGLLLWVVGAGVICIAHSGVMFIVGTLLAGIGFQCVWPGTVANFLKYVPASRFAFAGSLFTTAMCAGCFICSYFVSLVGSITGSDSYRTPVIWGFFGFLAVAVIWAAMEIVKPAGAEKTAQ